MREVMRALLLLLVFTASASAQPAASDDGYCDYVAGVASSTSSILMLPTFIGMFGYVDQGIATTTVNPQNTLRAIAGVKYSFSGAYQGFATRAHADADCRRHNALEQVRGETIARALAARIKVLDEALVQAEKILKETTADYEARRTTAQEATALRLRVEELRALDGDAKTQLSALPAPDDRPLGAAMVAYHAADADMEENEAKIRKAQGFDLVVRAGIDEFLDSNVTDPTQFFGLVELDLNLGLLFQHSANSRAAAGRKRLVQTGHDPLGVDATIERVRTEIEVESHRQQDNAALVAELQRQIDSLSKIPGDDAKKYRQSVWFDFIKAKADQAYLVAHLAALHEVAGGEIQ
jgi:hypothetical protein